MGTLGADHIRLMQGLAQEVMERSPKLVNAEATVGELAWNWAGGYDQLAPFWRHHHWFVAGRLAGWGWARLPYRIERADGTIREDDTASLIWQASPDHPELLTVILDWYDETADGASCTLTIQSADVASRDAVTAHGYVYDEEDGGDDGDWHQFNARDLADLAESEDLPAGFRFVSAAEVSVEDAVTAHREAWHPSTFTVAALERVQRTWPYRKDLHVLVAAPDGSLVATAIIWLDEATRSAEFEPVGTHRKFRRQGLGAALQLHGMRLASDAGAEHMYVACLGAPKHEAARGLYYSVGFQPFTRDLPYIKDSATATTP